MPRPIIGTASPSASNAMTTALATEPPGLGRTAALRRSLERGDHQKARFVCCMRAHESALIWGGEAPQSMREGSERNGQAVDRASGSDFTELQRQRSSLREKRDVTRSPSQPLPPRFCHLAGSNPSNSAALLQPPNLLSIISTKVNRRLLHLTLLPQLLQRTPVR